MDSQETKLKALDYNQQGIILLKAGNVEIAKEKFNQAIEVEPMVMDSYKNLGDLYLKFGEYVEAKNHYKKALLIEKAGVVYFQYGNACFMNDEPHEGLEYYNLALSAGFDSDEMYFFMGMAYEHMNDDKMALRYVQKAIFKNPSRPDFKVKKISILLRLNLFDEAKIAVDALLLSNPELYDGYHMKIAILLEEKSFGEAVEFARKASERFPDDADLTYDYVNALAMSKKYDESLQVLDKVKKMKYFEEVRGKFALLEAEVSAEQGDIDKAIEKCKECIELESDERSYSDARFMLINLALTVSDYESALEQANNIIEKNEKNSYYFAALYFRPFCLRKLERSEEADYWYKEAISFYRMATLQNPEAFDAYLYRTMCLRDTKQYDDALELLEFMENLSSEVAEIFTIRADIYKLIGKGSLAKEELEKAFDLKHELKNIISTGD